MSFKKIGKGDALKIYKTSFKVNYQWDDILTPDIKKWLDIFEVGTNCSKTLIMPSLMTLTSALSGPKVSTSSNGSFRQPLNQFVFGICAPGGGKSNVFDKILQPVIEAVEKISQTSIGLENYTTAGLQRQQTENCGYGLIYSDEGERFLSSINMKQTNGESERALLCKLWSAKGDSSILSNGKRGFTKTSTSACVLIQPQLLLQELLHLNSEDGLIDRFLFFSSRPIFHRSEDFRNAFLELEDTNLQDFNKIFAEIYKDHREFDRMYELSQNAQDYYNKIVDNYANYINEMYNSDSDEDNENEEGIYGLTQSESFLSSSKDTCHLLRIATILHILFHYWERSLNGEDAPGLPEKEVDIDTLKRAELLYNCLCQQKSIFLQAISSAQEEPNALKMKKN